MADEREDADAPRQDPANKDRLQSGGRDANAAQPLNAGRAHGGPERYPAVDQTDAVERTGRIEQVPGESRSFDASADAPTPRQEAGETTPTNEGRLGPEGDPAEGKR